MYYLNFLTSPHLIGKFGRTKDIEMRIIMGHSFPTHCLAHPLSDCFLRPCVKLVNVSHTYFHKADAYKNNSHMMF